MKNRKSPRRRRLFCWLLMLLMLLTGCAGTGSNGDPTGPASGTDAGEPPEPSEPEQLLLAVDGESEFRIVLPLGASDLLEEAAQRIRSRIEETTGARLVAAGADALVTGNAVFGSPNPEETIRALKQL